MGDIEDGAFGRLVDWFIKALLWVLMLFGFFKDKGKK